VRNSVDLAIKEEAGGQEVAKERLELLGLTWVSW